MKDKDVKDTNVYPDMIQEDYKHYIYKNGRKYLEASISEALFYEKTEKVECKTINAKIYNSKLELTTIITSDKGIINKKEKNVFFSGNVLIKSIEKKTDLLTEEMTLDYDKNKMYSDKEILIKKDDGSYLKTNKMSSELKKQEITFGNTELKYFYDDKDNSGDNKNSN